MEQGIAIRPLSRAATAYALVAGAMLVMGGCSFGHPSAQTSGKVVKVTERDFHISVRPTRLSAGAVHLYVDNRGPDDHELIVVRMGRSPLPLRADGLTIDEDALEEETLGALEPGAPHSIRELKFHLTRGHYEMFCNMAGHFLAGMHTELVVT
jgi:uncharacterized cupredoxin-like copper-binding protein